jgi:hypothetical protein
VLLAAAVRCKDGEDVDLALIASFKFGFSLESLQDLLDLMSADWHCRHEDVVTALGTLRSPYSVYALFFATQWVPGYLEFDDARALATKALWALGGIPGEQAASLLKVLANWDDLIIREGAAAQLERRES